MSHLKHVATAIHHGECLAGEAEDLGENEWADRLERGARDLAFILEDALDTMDQVPEAKECRKLAQDSLSAVFRDVTCELELVLDPVAVARVTPSSHLDVGERTRYRLRRLEAIDEPKAEAITDRMRGALSAYEMAIDVYLMTVTEAQAKKERAVQRSQLFRLDLERAKARLMTVATTGSEEWKRIKRRTVRTKRARWLAPEGTPRGRVREVLEAEILHANEQRKKAS
jgi:hypothetical protein